MSGRAKSLGIAGLDDRCTAFGIGPITTLADLTSCLDSEVTCRVDQSLDSESPRLKELLSSFAD